LPWRLGIRLAVIADRQVCLLIDGCSWDGGF
jgi:hypothetical protein